MNSPVETLANLISAKSKMLSWPEGPKPYDGAWAPHWYDRVNASTGFAEPPGPPPVLSSEYKSILDAALPIYEEMQKHAI